MITYPIDSILFRPLGPRGIQQFARWAQEHLPDRMDTWSIYHPVCRAEWEKQGLRPADAGAVSAAVGGVA